MALPKLTMPGSAGGASGAEMMLRSLGLGDMIAFAKGLAENGTIENIVKFAEGIDELNKRLANVEAGNAAILVGLRQLGERADASPSGVFGEQLGRAALYFQNGGEGGTVVFGKSFDAHGVGFSGSDLQPADSPASGGLAELRDVGLSDSSAPGGLAGSGDARASDGARRSGRSRTAASRGSEE